MLFRSITISLLVIGFGTIISSSMPTGKVVFLRGNEVVSAREDGLDIKILTHDDVPEAHPMWSPDGLRIAYLTAPTKSSNVKAHANIVITNSQGKTENIIPVLSVEPDGTLIGGMRFVEEIGWYSNSAVFAVGSANPYIGEYRILDGSSAKFLGGYLGYQFTTCAEPAQVAYLAEERGSSPQGVHIEVNGRPIYSINEGANVRELHWSSQCDRLPFLENDEAGTRFVVFHSNQLEAKIPLQDKDSRDASIVSVGKSFLLTANSTAKFYAVSSKSLQDNRLVTEQTKKQNESRAELVNRLGGRSADWWGPNDKLSGR
ncbi:MAG: hypothetical protein ACRD4L_00595 [Pyrinomonadaceae bacterium]